MFNWLFKFLVTTIFILLVSLAAGFVMAWAGSYLFIAPNLPDTKVLNKTKIQTPLHIYSLDGKLIGRYGSKNRKTVDYNDTPQSIVNAILAAEDDRFFQHKGVDLKSLGRAIYSYVDDEQRLSGGSTITMQLAKMYFLTYDKTILRKLYQIFLAWHIEMHHSKEDILELYLNKIFLGNHAYGVATAAQTYYNKSLEDLTLAQTAMIAGLPKAPSANNPLSNPEAALERRNWILKRMYQLGYIDYVAYMDASDDPITAKRYKSQLSKINNAFAYPAETARKLAHKMFGDDIYTGGYSIYTTIDSNLQFASKSAVIQGLNAYSDRHGYRGSEAHIGLPSEYFDTLQKLNVINNLHPAVVTSVESRSLTAMLADESFVEISWKNGLSQARPFIDSDHIGPSPSLARQVAKVGDVIRVKNTTQGWRLTQIPKAQAALIAIAPQDGKILAMTGGYDYNWSKFNRAVQAKRQPGSNLKPLLYAAAMELKNYTAASVINDEPIEFETQSGIWKPGNAGGKHYGPTRLRKALYFSRNVVSIKLLEDLGVRQFINYLQRFGLEKKNLPYDLSLALGTNSLAPLQVANIFADIANGGYHIKPHLISRIDRQSAPVYYSNAPVSCFNCNNHFSNKQRFDLRTFADASDQDSLLKEIAKPSIQQAPRAMDARVNYIIDSMLQDVIEKGTGQRAQALNRKDIRGKTGTTNGPIDAWFSGYHPDIAVTTWLGFDKNENLGKREFGGSAALPIWISFMHQALKDAPEKFMSQPDEIVSVPINPRTGKQLNRKTDHSIDELFRSENALASLMGNQTDEPTINDIDHYDYEQDYPSDRVLIYDTKLGAYVNSPTADELHTNKQQTQSDSAQFDDDIITTQQQRFPEIPAAEPSNRPLTPLEQKLEEQRTEEQHERERIQNKYLEQDRRHREAVEAEMLERERIQKSALSSHPNSNVNDLSTLENLEAQKARNERLDSPDDVYIDNALEQEARDFDDTLLLEN